MPNQERNNNNKTANDLGAEGAVTLCEALKINTTLVDLNLKREH